MSQIENYFSGERLQCMIGIGIAVSSIILALSFLKLHTTPFYKGFSYPFIIIPGLLLIICVGVVFKSSGDIRRVQGQFEARTEKVQIQEIPRMEKVMRNFKVIKSVELVLLAAGILLLILSGQNYFLKGFGLGLSIQSLLMYVFDYAAEARGEVYMEFLRTLA